METKGVPVPELPTIENIVRQFKQTPLVGRRELLARYLSPQINYDTQREIGSWRAELCSALTKAGITEPAFKGMPQ